MATAHRLSAVPMTRHLHAVSAWGRYVLRRIGEERLPQAAASLAFTSVLALVPLLTLVITLLSALPVFDDWVREMETFLLRHLLPEAAGAVVSNYVLRFAAKAAELSGVGLLMLVVTSLAMIATVERQFNAIWRVREQRPVRRRLAIYWLLATVGPLLVGISVAVTSWLVGESMGLASRAPGLAASLLGPLPMLSTLLALTLLYYVLPARSVRLRDALIGAAVASVLFEVAKHGFALYVASVPSYELVYGTLATLPVFLIWVYLSWLVVLAGATITATLPDFGLVTTRARRVAGADLRLAIRLLKPLTIAHDRGESLSVRRLAREARAEIFAVERLLESMREAGWVGRLDGGDWALTIAPEAVRIADVVDRFALARPIAAAPGDATDRRVRQFVARVFDPGAPENVTLRTLFAPFDASTDARSAQPISGKR